MTMLNFTEPQNTRIAPSPTGKAHIGFARTALLNYLAARATGGKFIVRIDDTDRSRSKQEYTDDLLSTLDWLGLEYDELQYQSKRFDRYREVAESLIKTGAAARMDGAVVFRPIRFLAEWRDLIAKDIGITERHKESIEKLVLLRADGTPTYHLASCVDDADMSIDLIIRGTDHIDNTAKHVHLFDLVAAKQPIFAHVGLIFHNGKKISKRDGLSSMEYYRAQYKPEAVLNALLKLGWGHPNPNLDKEVPLIAKDVAIKLFPEGQLKAAKSTLDLNKLNWLNSKF